MFNTFAAKGKGKGKGKGGGKEGGKEGGKPGGHTLPRTRITAEKFTGTVQSYKGKYGFIKPAEEIPHEKAAERNGNLFFGVDDIIGGEGMDYGAEVEFHIYEDESGLGADEIVVLVPGTGGGKKGGGAWDKGKGKGKPAIASWGGKDAGKGWSQPQMPVKGGWSKDGWSKDGWSKDGWSKDGWSKNGCGMKGGMKGDWMSKGKGKDGKGKKGGGKGHLLPRTRITAEKFTGTVSAWKGKYGWITPSEPIEHEKASLKNGSLFVSSNDLEGVEELTVGSTVEFHIAEDTSGLCAEEVIQY